MNNLELHDSLCIKINNNKNKNNNRKIEFDVSTYVLPGPCPVLVFV